MKAIISAMRLLAKSNGKVAPLPLLTANSLAGGVRVELTKQGFGDPAAPGALPMVPGYGFAQPSGRYVTGLLSSALGRTPTCISQQVHNISLNIPRSTVVSLGDAEPSAAPSYWSTASGMRDGTSVTS